jgi:hypothetical protein
MGTRCRRWREDGDGRGAINRMSNHTTSDSDGQKLAGRSWRRARALGARKGAPSMTSADAVLALNQKDLDLP